MFDWNDLKYLLAVAREGSTLAAAKALGVSQSTVQRRLVELEKRIGRPLVTRYATGYRLTELGTTLRADAEKVEESAVALERRAAASAEDVAGTLRVTCPEPLMYRFRQSSILDDFHARYPDLRVEFVMSDRYLDLAKGEADIAIRSGDVEEGMLVGRVIADSVWAVYASRSYIEEHGRPERLEDLARHALVGFDGELSGHRAAKWIAEVAPAAAIVARNNSVLGVLYAVKSGIGIAPLPTALGDDEPELVRVLGPINEMTKSWRLLTHPDLRRTPRVAAFFEFVVENLDVIRRALSG